jgi:hypothetical protein
VTFSCSYTIDVKWTPSVGPPLNWNLGRFRLCFYQPTIAKGCCRCCRCGHVGNVLALSIMSTALSPSGPVVPSRHTVSRHASTAPARPVHDRHEIEEAAAGWDVGDVNAPDLVRSLNRQAPQQIWEYLVSRWRLAGARLRAERRNVHLAHQPTNALAIDGVAFCLQHRRHFAVSRGTARRRTARRSAASGARS